MLQPRDALRSDVPGQFRDKKPFKTQRTKTAMIHIVYGIYVCSTIV